MGTGGEWAPHNTLPSATLGMALPLLFSPIAFPEFSASYGWAFLRQENVPDNGLVRKS